MLTAATFPPPPLPAPHSRRQGGGPAAADARVPLRHAARGAPRAMDFLLLTVKLPGPLPPGGAERGPLWSQGRRNAAAPLNSTRRLHAPPGGCPIHPHSVNSTQHAVPGGALQVRSTLPEGVDVLAFQCRNPIHRWVWGARGRWQRRAVLGSRASIRRARGAGLLPRAASWRGRHGCARRALGFSGGGQCGRNPSAPQISSRACSTPNLSRPDPARPPARRSGRTTSCSSARWTRPTCPRTPSAWCTPPAAPPRWAGRAGAGGSL